MDILNVIYRACLGREITRYPIDANNYPIDVKDVLTRIDGQLKGIQFDEDQDNTDAATKCIELARGSFDEVKALTEYQDQKTARLLTIIAFLTAAAAAVFAKVLDLYPLHQMLDTGNTVFGVLTSFAYAIFILFLLFVAMGALVSFHAMQTRFLWDKNLIVQATGSRIKSHLFFQEIIAASPEAWASSFLDSQDKTKVNARLSQEYFKNYIAEAYVIAAKVADKVVCLQSAQSLLLHSIRLLVAWIVSLSLVIAFVPNIDKKDHSLQQETYTITFPNASHIEMPVSGVTATITGTVSSAHGQPSGRTPRGPEPTKAHTGASHVQ